MIRFKRMNMRYSLSLIHFFGVDKFSYISWFVHNVKSKYNHILFKKNEYEFFPVPNTFLWAPMLRYSAVFLKQKVQSTRVKHTVVSTFSDSQQIYNVHCNLQAFYFYDETSIWSLLDLLIQYVPRG